MSYHARTRAVNADCGAAILECPPSPHKQAAGKQAGEEGRREGGHKESFAATHTVARCGQSYICLNATNRKNRNTLGLIPLNLACLDPNPYFNPYSYLLCASMLLAISSGAWTD